MKIKNSALLFSVIFVFTLIFVGVNFAQDTSYDEDAAVENQVIVKGEIEEISEDGSYIIVNDGDKTVKFITSTEILEAAYMEIGDNFEFYGEETSNGLKLVDYEYVYGDSDPDEEKD